MSPFILLTILPITLLLCALLNTRKRQSKIIGSDVQPLYALQALMVPTRSHWPASYHKAAKVANKSKNKIIRIPLSLLLDDIFTGVVELRNPVDDLPLLLHDR